jgi:hypothetical protein
VSKSNAPIVLHDGGARPAGFHKPAGFWYEVDGDWRRWCYDEGAFLDSLRHFHAVELNDCQVLLVNTLAKLDAFHARYGQDFGTGRFPDIRINWDAVTAEYDGLEIAPYQWQRRLERDWMWYYGWDCAAGVIWRPRHATVTYLGPVERQEVPA